MVNSVQYLKMILDEFSVVSGYKINRKIYILMEFYILQLIKDEIQGLTNVFGCRHH